MSRPHRHLYLVPAPAPLASFEARGQAQAREAAERLVAAEMLAFYDQSPETKEALSAARSAMVVHRLLCAEVTEIEKQAVNEVLGYFLEG